MLRVDKGHTFMPEPGPLLNAMRALEHELWASPITDAPDGAPPQQTLLNHAHIIAHPAMHRRAAYVEHVMLPLLSRPYVHQHALRVVPHSWLQPLLKQCHRDVPLLHRPPTPDITVALQRDHTRLGPGPATLCVEIKPKSGVLCGPRALVSPDLDIKRRLPRFTLHQHYKQRMVRVLLHTHVTCSTLASFVLLLRVMFVLPCLDVQHMSQGTIDVLSAYDPCDLFSQQPPRVHAALQALWRTPHNNLKLFVDGRSIPPIDAPQAVADALPGVGDAVAALLRVVTRVLTREGGGHSNMHVQVFVIIFVSAAHACVCERIKL